MRTLPFRWQGTTRAARVRSHVLARVQQWATQWAALPLDIACIEFDGPRESQAFDTIARGTQGALRLHAPAAFAERLGAQLACVASTERSALAEAIGHRALDDLMRSLLDASATREEATPAEHAAFAPDRGAVRMRLEIGRTSCVVEVDAALADAWVPRAPREVVRLVDRRDAIGHADVAVEATLDLGHVALLEALALQPGDVFRTKVPLAAAIALRGAAGTDIARGTLGAIAGRRVLHITQSNQGKQP